MSQEILQNIIDDFSPEKFSRFFRDKNRSFAPRQESFIHYNDESFTDGVKLGEIEFSKTKKSGDTILIFLTNKKKRAGRCSYL